MSRINPRALALLAVAAFLLRLGVATLTERHPLFPDYYYTDAHLMNAASLSVMDRLARGEGYYYNATLGQRTQVLVQTSVYRLLGVHPFAMKALNCILGAAAVAALAAAAATAFSPPAALMAAALFAVWPSNVFYTSQNFKEAPNALLVLLALCCLLPLSAGKEGRRGDSLLAAAGALFLLGAGFYRSYVMLTVVAALAASFVFAAVARRTSPRRIFLGLTAALSVPLLYHPVASLAAARLMGGNQNEDLRSDPVLVPVTYDETSEHVYAPTSPRAISEFRRLRQKIDRDVAVKLSAREIATQLFPDARFETWFDVLAFLPKASFYVAFMPLPGLYPIDGKLGRAAASFENLLLLALAGLAAAGALRGPRTPARLAMLLFFAMMTAGSALLEFDLGSAGRHKLLYLPMLFPFAAEEIFRLLGRKEPA